MEESVSNKDDKQSKSIKSKITSAKKRRNWKIWTHSRRKKMCSVKASILEKERQRLIYDTVTDW